MVNIDILDADNTLLARRLDGIWVDTSGRPLDEADASIWAGFAAGRLGEDEVWPGASIAPADAAAYFAELAALKADRRRKDALHFAKRRRN